MSNGLKAIVYIEVSLSDLYQKTGELKGRLRNDYVALSNFVVDGNAAHWINTVQGYLSHLEGSLVNSMRIAKQAKEGKSDANWELLASLDKMFSNEGSVLFAVPEAEENGFRDPFNYAKYLDFPQWKHDVIEASISLIDRARETGKGEDIGKLKERFDELKYLYKEFDPKDRFDKLVQIASSFRDSKLVESYNALKEQLYSEVGFEFVPEPYPRFISSRANIQDSGSDDESAKIIRRIKSMARAKEDSGNAEADKQAAQQKEKLEASLENVLENGGDFDSLKDAISDYIKMKKPQSKALSIIQTTFGPMLVPNPYLQDKMDDYVLEDIGGLEEEKQELGNHFKKLVEGKTKRKGVLLYGDSGTGKTSLIYSFVNEYENLKLIDVSDPLMLSLAVSMVDDGNPYILLVDDKSTFGSPEQVEIWSKVLDGELSFPERVEVVLTTNMTEMQEKMIQRFGLIRKFEMPKAEERSKIIDIYAKKFDVDVSKIKEVLINKTDKYSGREIKQLFEQAEEAGIQETPDKMFGLIEVRNKNKPKSSGNAIYG